MGRWWDGSAMEGPMLAGAETVSPPMAPEQERHHWLLRGGGRWEAVAGTNDVGADLELGRPMSALVFSCLRHRPTPLN